MRPTQWNGRLEGDCGAIALTISEHVQLIRRSDLVCPFPHFVPSRVGHTALSCVSICTFECTLRGKHGNITLCTYTKEKTETCRVPRRVVLAYACESGRALYEYLYTMLYNRFA